jgi:hypothetical protein
VPSPKGFAPILHGAIETTPVLFVLLFPLFRLDRAAEFAGRLKTAADFADEGQVLAFSSRRCRCGL